MANRAFSQFHYSLVKGVVRLWCRFTISGASGAPTLTKFVPGASTAGTFASAPTTGSGPYAIGAEGIKSVSRVSAGVYLITLQDRYQRLLSVTGNVANATGRPTTTTVGLWTTGTDVTSATAPAVKVTLMTASATAGDPAAGDVVNLCFELQNSGVI